MKHACKARKNDFGIFSYVCQESEMESCFRFQPAKGFRYPMCEFNLNPDEMKGSAAEITDQ